MLTTLLQCLSYLSIDDDGVSQSPGVLFIVVILFEVVLNKNTDTNAVTLGLGTPPLRDNTGLLLGTFLF